MSARFLVAMLLAAPGSKADPVAATRHANPDGLSRRGDAAANTGRWWS